jgi:hypothetical protein
MKKVMIELLVLGLLALGCDAYAAVGNVQRVFNEDSTTSTSVATSRGFLVKSGGYFGAWVQQTAPIGTPNIDVTYQMSYDDVEAHYTTPVTASLMFDDWTSETASIVTITPTPMKYIRFKAYGNAANTTGTTITMYLFTQE